METLSGAAWPGNVRQLRNVLERLVVAHPCQRVTAADVAAVLDPPGRLAAPLPPPRAAPEQVGPWASLPPEPPPPKAPEGVERDRLVEALKRAGRVQARAARLLGMTVRQLRYRIAKHAIALERF